MYFTGKRCTAFEKAHICVFTQDSSQVVLFVTCLQEDELTVRPTTGEKGFSNLFILSSGCRSAQSYVIIYCCGPALASLMNSCVAGTSSSGFGSDTWWTCVIVDNAAF